MFCSQGQTQGLAGNKKKNKQGTGQNYCYFRIRLCQKNGTDNPSKCRIWHTMCAACGTHSVHCVQRPLLLTQTIGDGGGGAGAGVPAVRARRALVHRRRRVHNRDGKAAALLVLCSAVAACGVVVGVAGQRVVGGGRDGGEGLALLQAAHNVAGQVGAGN